MRTTASVTTTSGAMRCSRFAAVVGAVLVALATSGAWAQAGKGDGRADRDQDTRQPVQGDQGPQRGDGRQWSQQDRDQLRRDIRDYGRDVYGDRDRGKNRDPASRPQRPERSRR
jgi:hypothetical protein